MKDLWRWMTCLGACTVDSADKAKWTNVLKEIWECFVNKRETEIREWVLHYGLLKVDILHDEFRGFLQWCLFPYLARVEFLRRHNSAALPNDISIGLIDDIINVVQAARRYDEVEAAAMKS